MSPEQWRAAWILCETAGDLGGEAQHEYVRGATVDVEVERRVIAVFEQLASELSYPPMPDRRVGDTVGRYRLRERIGQGGMGEVYAAEDEELRRTVALKFLPSAVAPDRAAVSQVILEARLASSLNHPNIVTVYELVQTPWGLAMVMELVEGQSLRALLKARRLSARESVQIGLQVASALAAAHLKGIVHRDIKPENVMVRADGYVKVLDFGLAQKLRDQALPGASLHLPVGTVRYMSPEQKLGGTVTGASDIYSLAVVLEEIGSWRHPLLKQMRSAAPEERPSAARVMSELERLGKSPRWPLFATSVGLLALLSILLPFRFWNGTNPSEDYHFRQVTSYGAGHDVRVARLSPDGKRLAYATVDGALEVRNNQTASVQELNAPPNFAFRQLLFGSNDSLLGVGLAGGVFQTWAIPFEGSRTGPLLWNAQLVALSHDEKRLAWLNDKHEIWTGPMDRTGERLLYRAGADERIAGLFWSADDERVWFNRLRQCTQGLSLRDVSLNPDSCGESDLGSKAPGAGTVRVEVKSIRLNSGFFADDGTFFFLGENGYRVSNAGFNVWSLQTKLAGGGVTGRPHQLSHLDGVMLSDLTGSRDGRNLAVIRIDGTTPTYVADWRPTASAGARDSRAAASAPASDDRVARSASGLVVGPLAMLRNQRRLTLEQANSYPHAWTPDSQSVIFESDRNGRLEIFRQDLKRREAELLVATAGDVYMPQVTPDGKWLLMMYRDVRVAGEQERAIRHLLLRAPITGGRAVEVPLSRPLDEFRCSLPGHGTGCVLRITEHDEQRYFELDPIAGQGRELARSTLIPGGLGRWSLSPDGRTIAIPGTGSDGRFLEVHLDVTPSRRLQVWRKIEGFERLSSLEYVPSGVGWLSNAPVLESTVSLALLSTVGDLFRPGGLFYVDLQLRPHLIFKSSTNIFGIVSPDEKHIALLGTDFTSNVWSLESASGR